MFALILFVLFCLITKPSNGLKDFDHLKRVKTFEAAAFPSHEAWTKAMDDLVLLVNSLKVFHEMSNNRQPFSETSHYESLISGFMVFKVEYEVLIKNFSFIKNMQLKRVLFKKWDFAGDDNEGFSRLYVVLSQGENNLLEWNDFKVSLKSLKHAGSLCYVLNADIVSGTPISEASMHFMCMDEKQKPGDINALITLHLEKFRKFSANFKQTMLGLFQKNLMTGKINPVILSYFDVSFRMHCIKEAQKYDSKQIQEALFWSNYKSLWKSFVPGSLLIKLYQLIDVLPDKQSKFITHVHYNAYQQMDLGTKVFDFSDRSKFVLAAECGALSLYALGPFFKEPLTWPAPKSPKTALNKFSWVWNSAILRTDEIFTFSTAISNVVQRSLLELNDYNHIMSRWNAQFVQRSKELWKMKDKPILSYSKFEARFSNTQFYDFKWLIDKKHEGKKDFVLGSIYSRPIAMFSAFPSYSTEFLPAGPQTILEIESTEAVKKVYDYELRDLPENTRFCEVADIQ